LCRVTHVLLAAAYLPRHGDSAEAIGAALLAKAQGRGHRGIAADLNRPPGTVRRWLRRIRPTHLAWLYRQGIDHAHRLDPEALNDLVVHDNDLANALTALAGAVVALRRRFARPARTWTLIAAFTGGQLLGPAPAT
jgi:hypothetical protein